MFLSVDFVLVCLTIVLTIIYYSRKLKKNYSLFEELKIPGPSPKWIFGNIQDFRDKRTDCVGHVMSRDPKQKMCSLKIGSIISAKKLLNPFDVFKLWRKQYGNIYGYFEGFRPSIVVNDPEMAKNILVKYFDKFHARPIHNPFSYYPDNHSLLNTSGSIWKQQRAIVAKAFNMASMEHL
ncbi:hypothetical protein KUTeg_010931 [Tegillarca granosa]|uniref:Cytochrome P450 n=1 Tax=Tegillarca granosa TaxID=220873 RepID=A0ABQ9F5T9_TEGGR|nr:hypothetical protein KUTeg_010931 [Tegillarca granosa]